MCSFWFCRRGKQKKGTDVYTWNLQPFIGKWCMKCPGWNQLTTHTLCNSKNIYCSVLNSIIATLMWYKVAGSSHTLRVAQHQMTYWWWYWRTWHFSVWRWQKEKNNNYLQLQLYDLLFQLPHLGFFPVSSCLSCDSVLEFPGKKKKRKKKNEMKEVGKKTKQEFNTFFPRCWLSALTWLGFTVLRNHPAMFLPRRHTRISMSCSVRSHSRAGPRAQIAVWQAGLKSAGDIQWRHLTLRVAHFRQLSRPNYNLDMTAVTSNHGSISWSRVCPCGNRCFKQWLRLHF